MKKRLSGRLACTSAQTSMNSAGSFSGIRRPEKTTHGCRAAAGRNRSVSTELPGATQMGAASTPSRLSDSAIGSLNASTTRARRSERRNSVRPGGAPTIFRKFGFVTETTVGGAQRSACIGRAM